MKKILSLLLVAIFAFVSSGSVFADQSQLPHVNGVATLSVGPNNNVQGNLTLESRKVTVVPSPTASTRSASTTYQVEETYSGFASIAPDGTAEILSSYPSTSSQSEQNVYWKATVSVTYLHDDSTRHYFTLLNASGSWVQLRGTSTLANRTVYYALNTATGGDSAYQYPTTNTFSYDANFGPYDGARETGLGCSSDVDIILQSGLTSSLYANVGVFPLA